MLTFAYALLTLVSSQGQPLSQAPVRKLVIVSSREIAETTKNKALLSPSAEEAAKHFDKRAFTVLKSKGYTFIIEASVLAADLAKSQKIMYEAMETAIKNGAKRIDVGKLPPEARKAFAAVLRSQIEYIDPGLRHLIDSPDLKISMMPEVVTRLESGGKQKTVAAGAPLDQNDLLTGPPDGGDPAGHGPDEPVLAPPENALRFYFSIDFTSRRSSRLKAMSQFGTLVTDELGKDFAAADAAYERLRSLLLEDQFGAIPAGANDVSRLPKRVQDALGRDIGGSFKFQGFDSRPEAESWLYNARIVSTHNYVSISFGGYDRIRKQPVFAIFPLRRP